MRWAALDLTSRTATPKRQAYSVAFPSASGRVGLAGCRPRRDRAAATGAQQNSRGPTSRTVPGGSPYHHRHQHGQQRDRDPDDRLDI